MINVSTDGKKCRNRKQYPTQTYVVDLGSLEIPDLSGVSVAFNDLPDLVQGLSIHDNQRSNDVRLGTFNSRVKVAGGDGTARDDHTLLDKFLCAGNVGWADGHAGGEL